MQTKKFSIMGNKWLLCYDYPANDPLLKTRLGYTDFSARVIVIDNTPTKSRKPLNDRNEVVRHEVIHAYLMECGLHDSTGECKHWALNEEMVDWFSKKGGQIHKTWEELGCLEMESNT